MSDKQPAATAPLPPTICADVRDELPPMVCIVRASGEGVTDWKLCRTEAEIRAAYVEMVCGDDNEHHKEEIDGIMEAYRGDGWRGDTLKIDLYCASFTITRFPAGCLATPSESATSKFGDCAKRGLCETPLMCGEADKCLKEQATPSAIGTSTPVAWRYRYGSTGMWRYVDSESKCNPHADYEREPLFTK